MGSNPLGVAGQTSASPESGIDMTGATRTRTPSKRPTLEEVSVEQYNAVVEAAELRDVRLVGSQFLVKPEYFLDEDRNKFSVDRSVEQIMFGPNEEFLIVPVSFGVSVKQGRKQVLSCSGEFLVVFSLEAKVHTAAARLFGSRIAMNTAYPYFRAYVASQSWISGAELPPLPIQKQAPRKAKRKQE